MLTRKTALPDSPQPVIVNKNPGFRALDVAGRNEFRTFHFWLLASAQKYYPLPEK